MIDTNELRKATAGDTPKPVAWIQFHTTGRAGYASNDEAARLTSADKADGWSERPLYSQADFLAMQERAEKAEEARNEAIRLMSEQSQARGVAEGKLAASELAGIVEGWKERAEAAELEVQEQAKLNGMGSEREAALQGELERTQRNRDMWKGQVDRQAKVLEHLHYNMEEIRSQAAGHKKSMAYNDGVNIALANIENIARAALKGNTDV